MTTCNWAGPKWSRLSTLSLGRNSGLPLGYLGLACGCVQTGGRQTARSWHTQGSGDSDNMGTGTVWRPQCYEASSDRAPAAPLPTMGARGSAAEGAPCGHSGGRPWASLFLRV